MKKYIVETISIFRMRYVVEAKEETHALDEVTMNVSGGYDENWKEFSQNHVDECIVSSREITDEEYFQIFDKDNDYLKDWSDDQKLQFVNKINYEK